MTTERVLNWLSDIIAAVYNAIFIPDEETPVKEVSPPDEKPKMWYSRFVAIEESDYQLVVGLLEKAAEENPEDENTARTLDTFKRNQEEHYACREEYFASIEAKRESK